VYVEFPYQLIADVFCIPAFRWPLIDVEDNDAVWQRDPDHECAVASAHLLEKRLGF